MATVNITYKNKILRVDPDPVEIFFGESITWILETDPIVISFAAGDGMLMRYQVNMLTLYIYFSSKSPFYNRLYSSSSTIRSGSGHGLLLTSNGAEKRGEFKYGIKLIDDERSTELEDEDPIIIVK